MNSYLIELRAANGVVTYFGPSTERKITNLLERRGYVLMWAEGGQTTRSKWAKQIGHLVTANATVHRLNDTKSFPDFTTE